MRRIPGADYFGNATPPHRQKKTVYTPDDGEGRKTRRHGEHDISADSPDHADQEYISSADLIAQGPIDEFPYGIGQRSPAAYGAELRFGIAEGLTEQGKRGRQITATEIITDVTEQHHPEGRNTPAGQALKFYRVKLSNSAVYHSNKLRHAVIPQRVNFLDGLLKRYHNL